MRKLIINIEASSHEFDLDGYYDEDEEIDNDSLYDGFVHEVITNPKYTWKVVEE